ncbi:hypothetical protein EYC84_011017 [Monilinia fructicola]|uniref:Indoleamine 2,3-dioxygenase n=1 Tax=Monilinia fructicola TaxID=38448 RepID=A0A5M9J706_MONFR|nr:hypothetical protein EYC84_011017 [Monilinia fructicola]
MSPGFILVSVAIEARAAPVLPLMLTAIEAARKNDSRTVTSCLRTFAERLDDLGTLLQRMHESCDPHVFYNRIRPFLAGSKNMEEAGLPNGVFYDEGNGVGKYHKLSGGSNAQSSILQFFDIVLGIEHRPTGEKKDAASESEAEGAHRRFLEDMSVVANIRDFVEAHTNDHELCLAYDACLAMLRTFRDKTYCYCHSLYRHQIPRKVDIATASRGKGDDEEKKRKLKGTGGTALIPFLKQARDETGEPTIDSWARRVMNRDLNTKGTGDFFVGKLDERTDGGLELGGLAGTWTLDEEVGGLCHY